MEALAATRAAQCERIAKLVAHLAAGEFDQAFQQAPSSRVNAEDLERAISEYGRRLVPLPPEGLQLIDYVEIQGVGAPCWSVVVPLFTEEEGRSDLSLELTIQEQPAGVHTIEIDDVHVL